MLKLNGTLEPKAVRELSLIQNALEKFSKPALAKVIL